MPEILGIIPARANSKRIPGKNLRKIAGKPLVQYALEAALDSKLLSAIVLSSDSDEILSYAGINEEIIEIKRPSLLSVDDSPAIDFVLHVLEYMQKNTAQKFDLIVIIQPSSPLTTGVDIDNTIQTLLDNKTDCAVSVRELPYDCQPSKCLILKDNKLFPFLEQGESIEQSTEKIYVRNGSVYVSNMKLVRMRKLISENCAAYIMPPERSVDINTELDLLFAEFLTSSSGK